MQYDWYHIQYTILFGVYIIINRTKKQLNNAYATNSRRLDISSVRQYQCTSEHRRKKLCDRQCAKVNIIRSFLQIHFSPPMCSSQQNIHNRGPSKHTELGKYTNTHDVCMDIHRMWVYTIYISNVTLMASKWKLYLSCAINKRYV